MAKSKDDGHDRKFLRFPVSVSEGENSGAETISLFFKSVEEPSEREDRVTTPPEDMPTFLTDIEEHPWIPGLGGKFGETTYPDPERPQT